MVDTRGVFTLERLQLGQLLVVFLDGGHVGVDLLLDGLFLFALGLFQLAKQRAVGLAELVAPGSEVAGLGDGLAVFGVELKHLVHHRQLLVLKFLPDVLFDDFGVISYKFNVEQGFILLIF